MADSLELSAHTRRAFGAMADDLARVFGARLTALVAYAPDRAAAFVTSIDAADLDALSVLADAWHKSQLHTPLLLTVEEFSRSLDAFPLEYQAILDRHVVIAGIAPFSALTVNAAELRRACETKAKGHLIHLRQSWIEAAGHTHELEHRLAESAMPLRVLLTQVARLAGADGRDPAAFAAAQLGADAEILRAVLNLETHPDQAHGLLAKLPAYLTACEHIWNFVDGWRA